MKQILLMCVFLIVLAGTAFAGTVVAQAADASAAAASISMIMYAETNGATANRIAKMSTGVAAGWKTSAQGYALVTWHDKGTKSFGSAFDSTAIFNNATKVNTPSSSVSSTAFGAGWTAL